MVVILLMTIHADWVVYKLNPSSYMPWLILLGW